MTPRPNEKKMSYYHPIALRLSDAGGAAILNGDPRRSEAVWLERRLLSRKTLSFPFHHLDRPLGRAISNRAAVMATCACNEGIKKRGVSLKARPR